MKNKNNTKIDFVIAWVDGGDPVWLSKRKKYDSRLGDSRDIRYRDWGLLKYWFRSVEKYAPWVNKIYFVTDGQKPEWIDEENEKLVIVDHKDFIPQEYLPTFNSNVIDINIHRIKGLEERFVYFNDDMFITDFVKPEVFFKNGMPCDSAILSPAIQEAKDGIGNTELNNMGIINTHFDKNKQISSQRSKWYNPKYQASQLLKNILLKPWNSFPAFYEFHVANAYLKDTFKTVWEKEGETLEFTCGHKFRDLKLDNNQWIMRDWQLASNNFVPRKTKITKLFTISDEVSANECAKSIKSRKFKLMCVNDDKKIRDFEKAKTIITEAFEKTLPKRSSFERGEDV